MGLSRRVRTFIANARWLVRSGGLQKSLGDLSQRLQTVDQRLQTVDQRLRTCELLLQATESRTAEIRRVQASHAWVYGRRMRLDPDDTVVSRHLEQRGCFEPLETSVVRQAVRPGDVVLDIGANIGYYTLQFSDLAGPSGHVYAFEPDPHNYGILRQNLAQNGCTNVTAVQAAVSAATGSMRLFLNTENHGDHRVWSSGPDRDSLEVPTVTIDDYLAGRDVHDVDFIKIDVQGAEAAVMQGMRGVLAGHPRLRMVTEFWPRGLQLAGASPETFLQGLMAEFQVSVIDEASGTLQPLDVPALLRLPRDVDTDIFFTNLYCERPGSLNPGAPPAASA